ncbi:hypothetical protein HDR60_04715, partial [bacterium]|nr:hypothetical protein [bacterium]
MKKVSIITLSLVMLMNGSLVFSAPRKRRNSGGVVPTATTTATVPTISLQNVSEVQSLQIEPDYITSNEDKEELKNLLSNLQSNIEKAKSSCSGIRDDLKTIQVLAGVSTGASSLGTLTSGGALVTGIMKAKTDKTIEELENQINKIKLLESKTENLSDNQEEFLKQLETIIPELNADVSALEGKIADETKKSQTLGNVRTGLMAGSIATSATSTITSGINIKKLDDLIAKMKDCDKSANQIKSDISMIESEIDNVDDLKDNASFTKAKNITQS